MKLFVYGTLKKGHYNHRILERSKFIRKDHIPGYTLYDTGHYPVAIKSEIASHFIEGEIYEIDHETWSIVNEMERYAGYKTAVYCDVIFFEFKDWLKATTKFKHIGSRWY
jgi:gamma-glutamylcyclotransferase (GGCT)/AIG2-like uncharacterized protein YtfP